MLSKVPLCLRKIFTRLLDAHTRRSTRVGSIKLLQASQIVRAPRDLHATMTSRAACTGPRLAKISGFTKIVRSIFVASSRAGPQELWSSNPSKTPPRCKWATSRVRTLSWRRTRSRSRLPSLSTCCSSHGTKTCRRSQRLKKMRI